MYVGTYACMYVRIILCMCVYVCMCIFICMYVFVCVYICVGMYACVIILQNVLTKFLKGKNAQTSYTYTYKTNCLQTEKHNLSVHTQT